jgi:hypothetical protein
MMDNNPNTSLIHTVCNYRTKNYKLVVYCSIWVRKCNFDRTCHYPQFVDERYYICLFYFNRCNVLIYLAIKYRLYNNYMSSVVHSFDNS